jgi:hypothetical protein
MTQEFAEAAAAASPGSRAAMAAAQDAGETAGRSVQAASNTAQTATARISTSTGPSQRGRRRKQNVLGTNDDVNTYGQQATGV